MCARCVYMSNAIQCVVHAICVSVSHSCVPWHITAVYCSIKLCAAMISYIFNFNKYEKTNTHTQFLMAFI